MKNTMLLKPLLLTISILAFLAAGLIPYEREGGLFALKFIMLFVSLLFMTSFFIKTHRIQEIINIKPGKAFFVFLFAIGFIFFSTLSFLLHGKDNTYVVSVDLDSIAYFIQAKIFSTGQINVPSHELKEFFTTGYFINDGKYYSMYLIGWPFLLSLGIRIGFPWIINPIVGLLTLLVTYLIGQEIYDKNTGLFAAILLLFSPMFHFFTPSFLSEPSSLFFSSLFFYFMVKTLKEPKALTSSLAGCSLGISFLIRPYSAFSIALPVMGYFFFSFLRDKRKYLSPLITVVLTFSPFLFLFFVYNYLQTGSILLTPYQYYNKFNALGFGLRSFDVFMEAKQFTLLDGIKNLSINLVLLNWGTVLFLFIFLFLIIINKKNKWDLLLFANVFATVFLHFFYHFRNTRYYYAAFFAFFLLAARGINLSDISFARILSVKPIKNLNYLFLFFIVIANIFVTLSPQKVWQRIEMQEQLRDPFNMVKGNRLNNSVVFLRSVPERYNNIGCYIQNPLDFKGDVLFVRDLRERNIELMKYYPEKEFYIYEFDRLKKSGKLTKLR
jgi:hypothetical protein